ncbi:MAG: hypothetical protein WCG02_02005 [Candidatus Taylorbacteria bacterium]
MDKKKAKKHIGGMGIAILVFLALVADIIGLIPFAEIAVSTIYFGGLSIYLWTKGYGFVNGRRLAVIVIDLVIGWIPAVQALPQITLGIIVLIVLIRTEEKTGISALSGLSPGKKILPLNKGGTRLPEPTAAMNTGGKRLPNGGLPSSKSQITDINVSRRPPEQGNLQTAA